MRKENRTTKAREVDVNVLTRTVKVGPWSVSKEYLITVENRGPNSVHATVQTEERLYGVPIQAICMVGEVEPNNTVRFKVSDIGALAHNLLVTNHFGAAILLIRADRLIAEAKNGSW